MLNPRTDARRLSGLHDFFTKWGWWTIREPKRKITFVWFGCSMWQLQNITSLSFGFHVARIPRNLVPVVKPAGSTMCLSFQEGLAIGTLQRAPKARRCGSQAGFSMTKYRNTYPRFNLINLYLTWFPRTRDFMLILVYQVCCFWWRGSESDPSGERSWKLGRIGRPDI